MNELVFTLVNSNGVEIRKEYRTVEEFKKEMQSDKIDIPMLDDVVIDLELLGVKHENIWDISALLDYLS